MGNINIKILGSLALVGVLSVIIFQISIVMFLPATVAGGAYLGGSAAIVLAVAYSLKEDRE
jgi:uncharacterized membrane protein